MRIIRFVDDQEVTQYGVPIGDGRAKVLHGDLFSLTTTGEEVAVKKLLAPLDPRCIFCIGANYAAHARESGGTPPERPIIFMKSPGALTHPGDPIRIPRVGQADGEVDYEGELAVIIGKAGRDIPQASALEHVFGYACANDVSARWWQKQGGGGQWVRGKSFDTFCPLGPELVTADEVGDPQALRIRTHVSGETLQDATTGDMIFPVAELISYMSQDTTLLPGMVILTGTPEGVGMARTPKRWLVPNDSVTIEIEKLGELTNSVVSAT